MPVELKRKLKLRAKKKDIEDPDRYVYGTMRKTGWVPSTQKEPKSEPVKKNGKTVAFKGRMFFGAGRQDAAKRRLKSMK
jgi:hypothetical protein